MYGQYLPTLPPLALLVIVSLALAFRAWRRPPSRPALLIAVLMLAVAEVLLAYMLELMSYDLDTMLFWLKVQYVGFLALPVIWLIFVLEYTGFAKVVNLRKTLMVTFVPVITLLALWTNEYHHLFYRSIALGTGGPNSMLELTYGPVFWVHAVYTYLLVLTGCLLILQKFLRTHRLYRMQIMALMAGVMLPLVATALNVYGPDPFPRLHLVTIAFLLSAIAVVWGLFRYRLLDVRPVARAALIEGMYDGVIVFDVWDRVVDINAAAQEILGQPPSGIIGKPANRALSRWPDFARYYNEPAKARAELELRGDGKACYYDVRASMLFGPEGDPSGRLFVMRDITERKLIERAEQEQRALAEALRDATASLASSLEFGDVLDRILIAAHHILPYDCGNVMLIEGDVVRVVRAHDHRECGLADVMLGLTLEISQTPNVRYMLETGQPQVIADARNDADWVPVQGTEWIRSHVGAPIRAKGRVLGFLNLDSLTPAFYTDTDAYSMQVFADQVAVALHNAQLYSSLEQANVSLQVALRSKDEMIQNVSHELRSPIAVLLCYLELLRNGQMGSLNDQQEQSMGVLHTQVERLQFMVERLLTLQSLEPKKLQRVPLELAPWLVDLAAPWQARGGTERIRLLVEVPEQLPRVPADSYLLAQVLQNLLDNAFKFSPADSVVELRAWTEESEVVLAVCDQGIGILAANLERIFDRFYQVDGTKTRRFGGLGIGLALSKAIVEAHGGHIWAESQGEGRGSSFYVALQREAAESTSSMDDNR